MRSAGGGVAPCACEPGAVELQSLSDAGELEPSADEQQGLGAEPCCVREQRALQPGHCSSQECLADRDQVWWGPAPFGHGQHSASGRPPPP